MAEGDIFDKLESYFFEDDEFAANFETFAKENYEPFLEQSEEHKLVFTEIYKKFQQLFESKLETFLKTNGYTAEQFAQLTKERQSDDHVNRLMYVILALADYEQFLQLMNDEARKHRK